jgi:hypothetical protein
MFGEFCPKLRGSQSAGMIPAGTGIDWWQQDVNTPIPPGWALCNGQVAVWQTGPRAGQEFITPNQIGMYSQGGDILGGTSTANSLGYGNEPALTSVGNKNIVQITNGFDGDGSAQAVAGATDHPPSNIWVRLIKL